MPDRTAQASPRLRARLAGFFYLLVFVTGALALVSPAGRQISNLIASACYVIVIALFYTLFMPVSRGLSLLAAVFGLAGCVLGALASFQIAPVPVNSLVFFGFYCLLIGYLIIRSGFLSPIPGAAMVIAGLGWLTFLSPSLVKALSPYNMAPGILGELVLIVWLLAAGVNEQRWHERAAATAGPRS